MRVHSLGLALLLAFPGTILAAPAAFPTVQERLAGLELRAGRVPFAWDARQGRLLLAFPAEGQELLYGAGLAGGAGTLDVALDRGQLGALALVRVERVGPRVLVRQLQTERRADGVSAEERRAVEESFPSAVLAALEIVAEEPGRLLVDASDWLLHDGTGVAASLRRANQGEWREEPARAAFVAERSGAFPLNTEIEALVTFTSVSPPAGIAAVLPDGRTLSLRVHHSLRALPEPGYEPLRQDPRVGILVRGHKDYGAPLGEPLERRLVTRWRLAKRDRQAALSEPREPLVYYLDRGIPEPERSAIREAALWWNRAFEQAGFRNAMVVRDLPEGATFLDARYSGIEWIHRDERAWSIGETQTDPRTGEILHAVARMDSHRRRTTARQWRNLARPRGACTAGDSPDPGLLAGLDVDGAVDERTLALQRLAYLSAHEVGHTLGFDHNWAATTFGWGSVMDYLAARVEVRAGALDLSDAYPTDVGSYDRLMVRWAYTPDHDDAARGALVREAYAAGQVFPLESDPRWAEYDWGPEPVAWLRTTRAVRRVILARFGPAQLDPGAPLYDLVARFNLAYLYHRFGIQAAQGYVGGRFQTNALQGDGQTPWAWVPAAQQLEALELLLDALEPLELDVPDAALQALVPPPTGTPRTREAFASESGPGTGLLAAARALAGLVVSPLLDPERAARLTAPDAPRELRLELLLRRLVAATWNAPAAASARHEALRRVAQRVVLDGLLDLAARPEATPEVRALVHARLVKLRAELRLRHAAEVEAEAHLRLCERDLGEFLEQPAVRRPRPPAPQPPPGRPIG